MRATISRKIALASAQLARRMADRTGVLGDLGGAWSVPPDCDPQTAAIIQKVQAYTLTPPARLMTLCDGLRYVVANGIPGAIVECGIWRGGSMMAAALTLLELGVSDRDIWLYDTFSEMPPFGEEDSLASGQDLAQFYAEFSSDSMYEIHPRRRVHELMLSTGYPDHRLHLVEGLVEETIPREAPQQVALCRLDTDFYQSTRHELEHLYPRIAKGGILIVDDYGEFVGARKAVDEYLARLPQMPLLHRVDSCCRQLLVD